MENKDFSLLKEDTEDNTVEFNDDENFDDCIWASEEELNYL